MNAAIKKNIKNLLSIAIIAGLVYYLWENWNTFQVTINATWYHMLGLTCCVLMTWVINSLQTYLLLRQVGIQIGFLENFILQVASILGNYLPMRLGTLIRMRYFKKVHGLEYMEFVGITGVRTLLVLLYSCVLVGVGLIALKLSENSIIWILIGIIFTSLVITLGSYLVRQFLKGEPKNPFINKKKTEFLTAFQLLRNRPILFWQISGLVLMHFITIALRFGISFDSINVRITPWSLFILAPITTLISFLSLTPGNLGLREWMIGLLSLASGIDFNSGIFAGTLDRAILMICTFIIGSGPLAYIWSRTVRSALRQNNNDNI